MPRSSAVETEPTPAPAPASERRRIDGLIERCAQARSVDDLPTDLRDNPIIRDIVSMPPDEEARMLASIAAHREAESLYGDDDDAELAALEAGTHPLQRRVHAAR
jgi:hypothetical protein